MILLRPDCLVFETANGEHIPAPIEQVTVELLGEAVAQLDQHIVQNAAAAVLHYFKTDLGQDSVSVGEFTVALEQTLRSLGLEVKATGHAPEKAAADADRPRLAEADLKQLVLLKLEGHTNEDVADLMKVTRRTIQRKLERIRRLWLESTELPKPSSDNARTAE